MQKIGTDEELTVVYDYTGDEPFFKFNDQVLTELTLVCDNAFYYIKPYNSSSSSRLNVSCMAVGETNEDVKMYSGATYGSNFSDKVTTVFTIDNGVLENLFNFNVSFTHCYISSSVGEYRMITDGDITLGPEDNAIIFDRTISNETGTLLSSITGNSVNSAKKFQYSIYTPSCDDVDLSLDPTVNGDLYTYSIEQIGYSPGVWAVCPYTVGQEPGPVFDLIYLTPIIMVTGLMMSVVAIFLNRSND